MTSWLLGGQTHQVYFDCNATTPTLPKAAEAASEAMRYVYGNPSSTHIAGLQAKHILESTRHLAADAVMAGPGEIVFTSGATEGIQTAVFSALEAAAKGRASGRKLLYGATEHSAVPQALSHWNAILGLHLPLVPIPVDREGRLDLSVLEEHASDALLVSTMAVNNETGVVQDLLAIERVLRKKNPRALWLVDCVQALGKIPLSLGETTIDYAAFSGHKVYAPKGVGFLYAKKEAPLIPLIVGGGQERGLRSGTENLPGLAALRAVLQALAEHTSFQEGETLRGFREKIVDALKKAFPKIVFNSPFEHAVPTTINFSVPGFLSKELLDLFDAAGVRVSSGSACSSGKAQKSHVLDAMGFPEWRSAGAIRLSFGLATSCTEVDDGCQAIVDAAKALRQSCFLFGQTDLEGLSATQYDGIVQLRKGAANTWILIHAASKNLVIIDPLEELAERIVDFVHCQGGRVLAILDTHSHADHTSCRKLLEDVLRPHLAFPDAETDHLGWPRVPRETIRLPSGDVASLLRLSKEVALVRVLTPGHTADSVSYLFCPRGADEVLKSTDVHFAFSGDIILTGGLGRTDFPTSSVESLYHSLRLLQTLLSEKSLICPAHDYDNSFATTWGAEKQENELLMLAVGERTPLSHEEFLSAKQQLDKKLCVEEGRVHGIVCGVTAGKKMSVRHKTIPAGGLKGFLASGAPAMLVIDVREPYEFTLSHDWKEHGFPVTPRNVPLSRFVHFMGELLQEKERRDGLLIVCRSGSRSEHAVRTLSRIGIEGCFHIEGGLAYGCEGT